MANWITDFQVEKNKYNDPNCHNCEVHAGFLNAEKSIIAELRASVASVSETYGTKSVKTTGHSLGAALAQLAAMDLIRAGYNVSMINFGQPRIGNRHYAVHSAQVFPEQYRVTHFKDIVPHIPVELMSYKHSSTEVFEDRDGTTKVCSSEQGEDKHCSDKFPFPSYNPFDHMTYLGTYMTGGPRGSCQSNGGVVTDFLDGFLA